MGRWGRTLVAGALALPLPVSCATGDRSLSDGSSEATSGQGGEATGAASASTGATGGDGGAAVSSASSSSTAASTGSGHVERDAGDEDAPIPPTDGPDLVADMITRDATYYYVEFCNVGTTGAPEKFTVLLTNTASNQAFESNPLYPFDVPPPGMCMMTGGFTCGLIGDPGCNLAIAVKATVDPQQAVTETNEGNNELTVVF